MQYKDLGKYIRKKRIEIGCSLNGFAIANDIDPAILSRIENLQQNIKLNILEKIALGFDQTPAQFLTQFESLNNVVGLKPDL
jgi:transcriptional regulator with XRE-family HTH domain